MCPWNVQTMLTLWHSFGAIRIAQRVLRKAGVEEGTCLATGSVVIRSEFTPDSLQFCIEPPSLFAQCICTEMHTGNLPAGVVWRYQVIVVDEARVSDVIPDVPLS